jgi:hypothetical protein
MIRHVEQVKPLATVHSLAAERLARAARAAATDSGAVDAVRRMLEEILT